MQDQPPRNEQNEAQERRHPNVAPFQRVADADQTPPNIRSPGVSAVVMPVR